MTRYNPFAQEIKYIQTVNKAISQYGAKFYIYRTINSKVAKCELQLMGVTLDQYPAKLMVTYERDGNPLYNEFATEQDLKLISQQAKQYAAATRK